MQTVKKWTVLGVPRGITQEKSPGSRARHVSPCFDPSRFCCDINYRSKKFVLLKQKTVRTKNRKQTRRRQGSPETSPETSKQKKLPSKQKSLRRRICRRPRRRRRSTPETSKQKKLPSKQKHRSTHIDLQKHNYMTIEAKKLFY